MESAGAISNHNYTLKSIPDKPGAFIIISNNIKKLSQFVLREMDAFILAGCTPMAFRFIVKSKARVHLFTFKN